jgi:glycosyltransferase involved in cell wall biosynthesis
VQATLIYAPIAMGFRKALAQAIQKIQPHVLHLHMPNNSVFWALTLADAREIPWVVHWHSDVVASRIKWAVRLAYQLYRPFEQAVLDRAERIIVTSPPYLQASAPLARWHSKCAVVPLGLNTDLLPPHTLGSTTTSPWRSGTLRLLSIGRLAYYKGFETLIQAVAEMPGVELIIAGEGESRETLERLIQTITAPNTTPNIRLLGHVTDQQKNALLSSCDIFCLASRERTEAFGMVLLEAMTHSRPCIGSNLPGSGLPWVVTQANAGLLAEPEDIPSWKMAISQLQQNPAQRKRFGEFGFNALQEQFCIHVCANRLANQYAIATSGASMSASDKGILIVIPAKNEAATIGTMLANLHSAGWSDIVVIDDQSDDGTGEIARNAGAHVLQPVLPVGAWGGMQAGIRYGLSHGYQAVITMDADGQHEVSEIPALLAARTQSDVVIGAFPERASKLRRMAWHWFRQLAGFDLRDLTSGFRLYNREAMAVLASREASLLDYQDLGALLLVRRAGLQIEEVPVSMNVRSAGTSRIFNSWLSVARYMAATTLLCLARWRVVKHR